MLPAGVAHQVAIGDPPGPLTIGRPDKAALLRLLLAALSVAERDGYIVQVTPVQALEEPGANGQPGNRLRALDSAG